MRNYDNFYNYVDNIIKNNRLSHTYLIEVNDYEEDFNVILNFIKMIELNCIYKDIDNNNSICKQIDSLSFSDLYIIEPDGAFVKKNQVLQLQDEFQNKSLYDNKRVYIIKEADKLNSSSANTILKFLEEPEDNLIAILLTTNRYKMIKTILSRCQLLSIKSNTDEIELDEDTLFLLDCIIKNKLFINYNRIIIDIISDKIIAKEKFESINKYLMNYINNRFENDLLSNIDEDKLYDIVLIIENELLKLVYNINYKMWLDGLFSRLIIGGDYY